MRASFLFPNILLLHKQLITLPASICVQFATVFIFAGRGASERYDASTLYLTCVGELSSAELKTFVLLTHTKAVRAQWRLLAEHDYTVIKSLSFARALARALTHVWDGV